MKLCFGIPKLNGENAKEMAAESPKKRKGRRNSKAEVSTPSKDDAVPLGLFILYPSKLVNLLCFIY